MPAPKRRQQDRREEQRADDRQRRRRARRRVASSRGAGRSRRSARRARAAPRSISRTWTGAGGVEERAPGRRDREHEARDEEDHRRDDQERPERPRAGPDHGRPISPIDRQRGARAAAGRRRGCGSMPSTRISSEPRRADGEIAADSVGGSCQAKMSVPVDRQRVRQRLARERAAERQPVADHPRGEDRERDDAPGWRSADVRSRRRDAAARQARTTQASPSQSASFRVSAASPMTRRRAATSGRSVARRVGRARRAAVARIRVHQQRRPPASGAANSIVESGRAEWRTSGRETAAVSPVPTASVRARPTGSAALRGDVGGQPPGEDRHERADEDRADLGGRERRAEERHRDRRRGTSAAAARPRRPARGNDERRRLEAPDRVG